MKRKNGRSVIVWFLTFMAGTLAAYLVILLAGLLLFVCAERVHG